MIRLAMLLYSMISTILMSVGVVAALVAGVGKLLPLAAIAGAGLLLAVPVSWAVARAMHRR